jgi:hypothetical protein
LQQGKDAQRELGEAQLAAIGAVNEYGEGSEEAKEARQRLTAAEQAARQSVIDLHGAASVLNAEIDNGTTSAESARAKFVDLAVQQGYTRKEAKNLADAFFDTAEEARDLGATDPNVEVTETGADNTKGKLNNVETAARNIPGRRDIDILARDQVSGVIAAINRNLSTLPQFKTVTVTTRHIGVTSGVRPLGRAAGGPVGAGRLYEVAEHGKAELLRMGGRSYLIPGTDGHVVPAQMTAAGRIGGGGGGGVTNYHFHIAGSVWSERELLSTINRRLSQGARIGAHGKRGL